MISLNYFNCLLFLQCFENLFSLFQCLFPGNVYVEMKVTNCIAETSNGLCACMPDAFVLSASGKIVLYYPRWFIAAVFKNFSKLSLMTFES